MKNKKLGILLIITSFLFIFMAFNKSTSFAASNELYYEGFEYVINNNSTITITDYIGKEKKVVIPSRIDGIRVTEIDNDVFQNDSNINSVKIPNSIISVGEEVFLGCYNLKTVELPDSITYISEGMFSGCKSLKNIEIPNNITDIKRRAFYNCSSLTNIQIPNSVKAIEYEAFSYCVNLTNIEISNSVNTIKTAAFSNCSGIINIELPEGLKTLEYCIFEGCTSLKSVKIPDSVTYIEDRAFKDCTSLKSIRIPKNVTCIGGEFIDYDYDEGVFCNCKNLRAIEILNKNTDIYYTTFINCDDITIYGVKNSAVEAFAIRNDIPFKVLGTKTDVSLLYIKTALSSYNYTGSKIKPIISVKEGNIVLKEGEDYIISYKNNINPGKGIATIKGINYYSGFKTIEFTIKGSKVSVGKVNNLKYTSTTSTETLYWSKVNKASGYEVWMYKSSLDDYSKVKTITNGSTVSYKKSNLSSATMYRYKVRAYRIVNGIKYYGKFTDKLITATKPLTPSVTLSSSQKRKIKISWSNVSSKTTGYEIYRSTSKYGKYTKIATIEDNNITKNYIDSGKISKKTYYYKVRAYRILDNGKKVYSSYSTIKYKKAK